MMRTMRFIGIYGSLRMGRVPCLRCSSPSFLIISARVGPGRILSPEFIRAGVGPRPGIVHRMGLLLDRLGVCGGDRLLLGFGRGAVRGLIGGWNGGGHDARDSGTAAALPGFGGRLDVPFAADKVASWTCPMTNSSSSVNW